MSEPAPIQDVQERVRDFAAALRSAGASEVAQRIERYAAGFVHRTEVRRSVAAIHDQLRYFRTYPDELPDLPIVQVAANRLEDVCRVALAGGLIEPAKPTLKAATKRKFGVILTTLAGAGLCFVLPLALTMFGVDWDDLQKRRALTPVRVQQGDEVEVTVTALDSSEDLPATRGVEFYVQGRCADNLSGGLHCARSEQRELGGAQRQSYEIKHDDQVYGVFVGFGDTQLLGPVGNGTVLIAATWDTPEGRYELPLEAAFLGYSPERCNLVERAMSRCQPRRLGGDAKHEGLRVPTVVVDVVRGDPNKLARNLKQKKAEEEKQRADAAAKRARELADNVSQIKAVLDDTQNMQRKQQWETVRERVAKLTQLFAPLDQLVVASDADPLPAEVLGLRARFDTLRQALSAFEDRAFDAAYVATRGPAPAKAAAAAAEPVAEPGSSATLADERLSAVAKKLRISPEYMDAIYAAHGEQLAARIAQEDAARRKAEEAVQAKLMQRCGPLPTHAFNEVKGYLTAMGNSVRVRTRLNDCLTPRLSDKLCWSVVCSFDEIVPGELTDTSRPRKWTFMLKNGRVNDHAERVLD